jgi:DNA polymerase-2
VGSATSGAGAPFPRPPAAGTEIEAAGSVEADAFADEQRALQRVRTRCRPRAHPPGRVDDPVPGHGAVVGKPGQRVADQAGLGTETRQLRDLAVGGHPAAWNPAHDGEDAGMQGRIGSARHGTGSYPARRERARYPAEVPWRGYLLQPTYRMRAGRPVVQLLGRLEGSGESPGPPFLVEDDRFRPYLFVAREAEPRLLGVPGLEIRPTALRALDGRAVLEVVVETPAAVARLRERLGGEDALEADVRFAYRYLIDRGIRSGLSIEDQGAGPEPGPGGLLRFTNPELAPADVQPRLRFLALDIETTPDASRVLAWALVGPGVDEGHLVAGGPVAGAESHPDEPALLRALVTRVAALDPDVLVGWNVVDFDLRVLAGRCRACAVPDHLGRLPEPIGFQQDPGFTRQSRAWVAGRVVLDGIALVRDALRLEDYRLETVARAVLGRGKLLDGVGLDRAAEIERLWREDPAALAAYNREDARLAIEILEREGLLDLAVERSLLSGMPLDRVGASIASFDRLYLPELRRRGFVAPSVQADRGPAAVRGGALLEPAAGLHRDVAVFDFKSLYPSLIRTFQLDPLAHAMASGALGEAPARDPIEAPNGARFARTGAILPRLIDGFLEARAAARARGARHADQAIKIMVNAFFGVLGAPACRFFDPAVANAITSFGQEILHWTAEAFRDAGVEVLYGDTDSVFVHAARPGLPGLLQGVEAALAARIRRVHRVEPRLELELERFFDRLWLPRVRPARRGRAGSADGSRSGGRASHKRYAGWADGRLVVVGLESVRRDWPAAARRLQTGMLERLFTDQPVAPYVREVVEAVRSGALDAELVFAKRIRKGALERYTATTPPHVQAARKLAAAGVPVGPVVRYVVTGAGPEPVLPGRPPPPDLDREHAVEHVLRPIAEALLAEVGASFDAVAGRPAARQLELW